MPGNMGKVSRLMLGARGLITPYIDQFGSDGQETRLGLDGPTISRSVGPSHCIQYHVVVLS